MTMLSPGEMGKLMPCSHLTKSISSPLAARVDEGAKYRMVVMMQVNGNLKPPH